MLGTFAKAMLFAPQTRSLLAGCEAMESDHSITNGLASSWESAAV
jgi:hypothetical protein